MEELNIIKQALEAAQAKGTFSMKDSHTIYEVVERLAEKLEGLESPREEALVAEEVKG